MKKSILIVMSMLFAYSAKAGNVPPVAVLTSTPNQTWFYNLEDVVFSSTSSYDTDGYVNYTRFYINGVVQYSSSYTSSYSACFALYGSPAGSCYQLANGATTVQVKVEVRDNSGAWSSQTKTYTIQAHKGRKYFVKDHLGTVRATVNRDGNVLGYDDYYPFGLVMSGHSNNTANPNDAYKFTGHERDKEASLTIDYMNARYYDPVVPRFMQIDPLADEFPGLSPYNYTMNNPITMVDPDGKSPIPCPGCKGFLRGVVSNALDRVDASPRVRGFVEGAAETGMMVLSDPVDMANNMVGRTVGAVNATLEGDAIGAASNLDPTGTVATGEVLGKAAAGDEYAQGQVLEMATTVAVAKKAPQGRPGKVIGSQNGVNVKSYGTNDVHKPAHAHVTGGGQQVRIGANGKPLKGQPELSSKQSGVVKHFLKSIRKEVNKVGKANKAIEDYKKKNE